MSVLVVDDDDMVRSTAVAVLQEAGYKTLEASDVTEALAMLENRADLITHLLTDVRMPGWQNGVDLAVSVRNEFPEITVVITSGYHEHADDAVFEGVVFLPKPWTSNDLVSAMTASP